MANAAGGTMSGNFAHSDKTSKSNAKPQLQHEQDPHHGSFLESNPLAPAANSAKTPQKTTASGASLTCSNCLRKVRIRASNDDEFQLRKKSKLHQDLLSDFNLNNECGDYSPNRKCANYIESNSFSPKSTVSSVNNTPKSAVKKSLLAKAIKNNSNMSRSEQTVESPLKTNLFADESMNVSMSSASDTSAMSTPNRTVSASLFSNLEVSEFEVDEEMGGEDMTHTDQNENANKEQSASADTDAEKAEVADIFFEANNILCDKCQLIENTNEDTSEVSLIAVDNDDQHDDDETNDNADTMDHERLGTWMFVIVYGGKKYIF